jgi:Metallo-beta-lactamase superfamily
MNRMPLVILVLAAGFQGGCMFSREDRLIHASADAMGGAERLQAVKTLVIEGEGISPNLGQNRTPDDELPVWKVTGYKRSIDLANVRTRVEQTRTAQFLFAGATVQHQIQGLDGEVAYNVGDDGKPARASAQAAQDRHFEMLHHPLVALRAALQPGASMGSIRHKGDFELIDLTTARGDAFTLAFDGATKLPHSITTASYNPNLGDVAIETVFEDYETVGGLKLPRRLRTTIDKYPQFDLRVTKNTLDAPVENAAATDAVKNAPLPQAPPVEVTAEPVAKGIWWLAGSGNHRSVLFEFSDHLVLFEAPVNEARSKAVIDKARSLVPTKPLSQAIVSHHHFDHSGGLRVAVAEGLTIVTYAGNVDFFKDLVARKHSIVEDALARNPRQLSVLPVADKLTLKDDSMEVQLYYTKDNPREGTNLFAYVPREKILVQADLYDSTWLQHPWGDNLAHNLMLRHLTVDRDVPVHGAIEPYAQVQKTIAAKKGSP